MNGSDVFTVSSQKTDFVLVGDGVEVSKLGSGGGGRIPLFRDGGISLGIDLGGFERFGHVAIGCVRELTDLWF